MKKLHDYLDYDSVIMILKNGETYRGCPIDVVYADESKSGEDEIDIKTVEGIYIGAVESDIQSIEIIT